MATLEKKNIQIHKQPNITGLNEFGFFLKNQKTRFQNKLNAILNVQVTGMYNHPSLVVGSTRPLTSVGNVGMKLARIVRGHIWKVIQRLEEKLGNKIYRRSTRHSVSKVPSLPPSVCFTPCARPHTYTRRLCLSLREPDKDAKLLCSCTGETKNLRPARATPKTR